jgi:hypothetical protein
MINPDSLCSRVVKGRYYPRSDFLQATTPANSSATWRAVIAGREALRLGLLKRIGDGSSVNIWHDAWVPGLRSMKPSVRIGDEPGTLNTVSELLDSESGCWKIDIIRANFMAPEADAILNIPLRRGGGEDFWA